MNDETEKEAEGPVSIKVYFERGRLAGQTSVFYGVLVIGSGGWIEIHDGDESYLFAAGTWSDIAVTPPEPEPFPEGSQAGWIDV